jgi:peptidoglycan/xylan/chitin deacetylase (PgdA/CDA1 family)
MKTLLKNFLFTLAHYSGITNLVTRGILHRKSGLPLVILIYHRITKDIKSEVIENLAINHPLRNFKKEMAFLKKHFALISLDEAVKILKSGRKTDRPTVVITFDDGFEDNYRLAFPVLRKLEVPATIFLTAGLIGTNRLPWPDEIGQAILHTKESKLQLNFCFKNAVFGLRGLKERRKAYAKISSKLKELTYSERINLSDEITNKLLPSPQRGEGKGEGSNSKARMLNWDEVKEMAQNNIAFGAHTMTHPILTKMPASWARKEILDSKRVIEDKSAVSVRHFAFPNGRPQDFNEELKAYCKQAGFESVSTAVYGCNKPGDDVYALKRLSPGRNMSIFVVDLLRAFLKR